MLDMDKISYKFKNLLRGSRYCAFSGHPVPIVCLLNSICFPFAFLIKSFLSKTFKQGTTSPILGPSYNQELFKHSENWKQIHMWFNPFWVEFFSFPHIISSPIFVQWNPCLFEFSHSSLLLLLIQTNIA